MRGIHFFFLFQFYSFSMFTIHKKWKKKKTLTQLKESNRFCLFLLPYLFVISSSAYSLNHPKYTSSSRCFPLLFFFFLFIHIERFIAHWFPLIRLLLLQLYALFKRFSIETAIFWVILCKFMWDPYYTLHHSHRCVVYFVFLSLTSRW